MSERNFPLLKPHPTAREMEKLDEKDPLFWGELTRLRNLADRILELKRKKRQRQYLALLLRNIVGSRGNSKEVIAAINKVLGEALSFIRSVIVQLPVSLVQFTETLNLRSTINEKDFIGLLIQWRELERRLLEEPNATIELLEFEARRLIVLTLVLFHLNLHKEKLNLINDPIKEAEEYLERHFFDRTSLVRRTIVSVHNPNDKKRVFDWWFANQQSEIITDTKEKHTYRTQLQCREFTWQNKTHPVAFSYRTKTPFSHLLKMLRKDVRDPYSSALDWRGIKFIFFSEEGVYAGLNRLREEAFSLPGMTWKLERGGFFERNPFSAANYGAKKFVTTLNGESVEIIVEDIKSHLNGTLSQGEENHYRYRQRQLVGGALPLLFPKRIYGIDWRAVAKQEN